MMKLCVEFVPHLPVSAEVYPTEESPYCKLKEMTAMETAKCLAQGGDPLSQRRFSGTDSPSEACSTSTDEGIYQEVDDDSNEETASSEENGNKHRDGASSGSPSVLSEAITEKCSDLSGRSPSVGVFLPPAGVPPPPPPPPPDFISSISKGFAFERKDVNCDSASTKSTTPRYIKNGAATGAKKSGLGPSFIPPQFTSPPMNDSNIKPSEYLKRVATKTMSAFPAPKYGSYARSSADSSYYGSSQMKRSVSENHLYMSSISADYEMISEAPVEVLEVEVEKSKLKSDLERMVSGEGTQARLSTASESKTNTLPTPSTVPSEPASEMERKKSHSVDGNAMSGSAKMAFSNATYCVTQEQLQGVLLKRQSNPLTAPKLGGQQPSTLTLTKNDLIEELKMAKNLEGIKKVKESHRNANEVSVCGGVLLGARGLPKK